MHIHTLKNKYLLAVAVLLLLSPFFAAAQTEQNYYEASSYTTSGAINVAAFSAVYQSFRPNNDFVSGFDVWFDNTGSSGTLHFALVDSTDSVLSSQSVTVSTLAPKWGGTRTHLNLGANVMTTSTAVYKLKMWTTMPQLKIYYVNGVDLLLHNASALLNADPVMRSAYLDATEESYVFKTAFYEMSTDATAPVVSGLSFTAPNANQMTVALNANEPVDYKMDYRSTYNAGGVVDIETGSYSGTYNFCVDSALPCGLTIPVFPNITYDYQLYVRDFWGNLTTITGSFDSSKTNAFQIYTTGATSTAPIATSSIISNAQVFALTPTSAQFTWNTNIPSASRVLVSTDPANTQVIARLGDNTFELVHSMTTGDILTPSTRYYAIIIADSYSSSLDGVLLSFITPAAQTQNPNPPPAPAPTPTSTAPQPVTNPNTLQNAFTASSSGAMANQNTASSSLGVTTAGTSGDITATFTWTPGIGGNARGYRIDIFDTNQKLVKQVTTDGDASSVNVGDLEPGEYRAIAYADRNGSFEKIAQPVNFKAVPKGSFLENVGSDTVLFSVAGFGLFMIMLAAIMAVIKKNQMPD